MRWAFLAIAVTGCAGAKLPETGPASGSAKPVSSTTPRTTDVTAFAAGKVRWKMLSPERFTARDQLELSKQETLYVGEGGERWIATTKPAPTEDDPEAVSVGYAAATTYAPETLISARKKPDGRFALIGVSGAVYEASGPLAEIASMRKAPNAMRTVAVGKDALVGLGRKGALLRSVDFGATWSSVAIAAGDRLPLRLAMSTRGEALLMLAPSAFLASLDDGATFAPVVDGTALSTVSGLSLAVSAKQELVAIGPALRPKTKTTDGFAAIGSGYAVLRRGGGGTAVLERVDSVSLGSVSMPYPQGVGELGYAEALGDNRGALLGTRWVEVWTDGGDESTVAPKLVVHDLAGTPTAKLLPAFGRCDATLLAGNGAEIVVGCVREEERKNGDLVSVMTVRRSPDLAATFTDEGKLDVPGASRLWLLPSGIIAAEGTGGLHVRSGKTWTKSKLPFADAAVQRIIGTRDGTRVYAIAPVEGLPVLLVSKDSGKTFEQKKLPQIDEEDPSEVDELAIDETTKPPTLVVYARVSGLQRYATQDDGAKFAVQPLALDPWSIALTGRRGLVSTATGEGFETADAGLHWSKVVLPRARGGGDMMQLACSADACIVGTHAARLGWELDASPTTAQATTAQATTAPVTSAPGAEPPPKGAPIASAFYECTTTGEPIATVAIEAIPLDRESYAWYAIDRAAPRGGAGVVMQPRDGTDPKKIPLLAESKDDVGTWDSARAEGAIAIRHVVVRDKSGPKAPPPTPVDVEVAWWVAATGKVHRAKIEKGGNPALAKHVWSPATGVTKLRSMAWIFPGSGVFVRASTLSTEAHWITEGGKVTKLSVPDTLPSLAAPFAMRAGKVPLLVSAHDDGWGFIGSFAEIEKGQVPGRFVSLWPRRVDASELRPRISTTMIGNVAHLLAAWPGDGDFAAHTWALPVNDPGAPVAMATLADLGTPPRACDAKSFAAARLELGWASGKRVAILVRDGARTLRLGSWETVAHAAKDPCVGAWAGTLPAYAGNDRVVLLPSDPTHATFFTDRPGKGERALVAKRMSCASSALNSGAPLPPQYAGQKGFD